MKAASKFCAACMILLGLTACERVKTIYITVDDEGPTSFRASTGIAQYENETYRWVYTTEGLMELDHSVITEGIMNDHGLTADWSDMARLSIGGKVWIRNSIVRGKSCIGNLARIYDSEICRELEVCKELYAERTHFGSDVHVDGDITAKCCGFDGEITALAEIIILEGTSTEDITVLASGPYYDAQVITLKNGSVVNGDITFESLRGKVCVDSTSQIYGQIIGGHVVKPFDCYNY